MRCNFVANGNLKLCRAEELRFAGFVTSQDFETGRRMMGSIGDSGDDRNNKKTRDRRLGKVDVEDLLNFIFPLNLQHPLSTGRLYAFGMYGPLDEDGNLRAGHNGQRVVSGWELDTMCLQFEREDILQVYIPAERPLFVLSEAQKEEVVAQADSHLKTAKGRGYRRQVTRGEVVQLLSGLPRDKGSGLISFHDAQALITRYRDKQIARFKVIFPDLTSGGGGGGGDDECGCECEALAKIQREGSARSPEMPGLVSKKTEQQQACPANKAGALKGGSGGGGGRRRGERRRAKFSPDVAPAEMFVKDAGLTPAGVAKYTNKLLSTRAYKVSNIEDGNNLGLTQNVIMIREDDDNRKRRLSLAGGLARGASWDSYACLRGNNIGAHVRSARSSTTAKRKA